MEPRIRSVSCNVDGVGLWRRSFVSPECCIKAVNKALPLDFKGLAQESNGSGTQHARFDGLVGIGCYEDDRYVESERRQVVLQVDAAHVRHLHIENQTSRFR